MEQPLTGTEASQQPKTYLVNLDGVLVRDMRLIPGADEFLNRLRAAGRAFLILTNNSLYTPQDLQARLALLGLEVASEEVFTSALATAQFLQTQYPGGSAYVVGEAGLTVALQEIGYQITEHQPDYVVLGETRAYNFQELTRAVQLVVQGTRFIATNPEVLGLTEAGLIPTTGAIAAAVAAATGIKPYTIGNPNPFMLRAALRRLRVHSETTVLIGDRMETDIVAGMAAGMETILVLSGMTQQEQVARFPYQPTRMVASVADIIVS